MISWARFRIDSPDLAAFGKRRLEGRIAYLATIRKDGSPRVHPVSPLIVDDRLFLYMEPTSPKGHDLRRDPRYMLHCGVEDSEGGQGEFFVRGEALEVTDKKTREEVFEYAEQVGFSPEERYVLFEFGISEAMSTLYDEVGPQRTRWKPRSS